MSALELDTSSIATLLKRKRKTPGATLDERKAAEKPAMSKTDGRRLRRTGRDVAINMKVTPEFKKRLYEASRRGGVPMVVIIERALEAYEKAEGKD